MIKIAINNFLSKRKYLKAIIYSVVIGILFFAVFYILSFSLTFEKKEIGSEYSKNYGYCLSEEKEISKSILEYSFIEDVITYKRFATIPSKCKLKVDDKSFILDECIRINGITDYDNIFSKNVYKEYGEVLLYGKYPQFDNEILINEYFLTINNISVDLVLNKEVIIYFPNSLFLDENVRGKQIIKANIVGIIKNNIIENDDFINIFTSYEIDDSYHLFNGYIHLAYYNTFNGILDFHDIIKNDTGKDFYHNMAIELSYLGNIKMYLSAFIGIVYVVLLVLIIAIIIIVSMNYKEIDYKNKVLRFIMMNYGANNRLIFFESIIEKILIWLISSFFVFILSYILCFLINMTLNFALDLNYHVSFQSFIILNLPNLFGSIIVIMLSSFIGKKSNY